MNKPAFSIKEIIGFMKNNPTSTNYVFLRELLIEQFNKKSKRCY